MTDYANLRKIVTGDVIVKCTVEQRSNMIELLVNALTIGRFGNEIRRIPINGVPTYDEYVLDTIRMRPFALKKVGIGCA